MWFPLDDCICLNTAHYIGLEKVTRAHFIFLCVAYLSCIRPYIGFYVKFPRNDNALDVDVSEVNTDFELCANNFCNYYA